MSEPLLPIELIDPNPYQPRKQEDPRAVEELALDILHHATPDFDGLMQVPTARQVNGRYQLAFGHTRLAAFRFLATDMLESRYEQMRVNVRELSDVQMFELAVAENIKRRDLNPLEQADAMRRYMDEFEKTSKQAGKFFGVSEETVRQKIRLLHLPESVQARIREGTITENAARSLLTLVRVLPSDDDALDLAVQEIERGERADEAVEDAFRNSPETQIIHKASFSTKQKSFKHLPQLNPKAAIEALADDKTHAWVQLAFGGYGVEVQEALEYLKMHLEMGTINGEDKTTVPAELIRRFEHLLQPPACTACPWFAQLDGIQYCGWRACFNRKREAHQREILHQTSERTGIAILQADDGKYTELKRWTDKHTKYFEKKGEDLRLKMGVKGYQSFDGIPDNIGVVVVGKTHANWKKQDEQKRESQSTHEVVNYNTRWDIRKIKDAQMEAFVWEHAAPAFACLLGEVKGMHFLEQVYETLDKTGSDALPESERNENQRAKMSKPERIRQARTLILFQVLLNAVDVWSLQDQFLETPTAALAKKLKGIATTWGVKLPTDFERKAEDYDNAIALEVRELTGKEGKK